ncbi:HDOD domain-containing protein [Marinobacterium sediminicola]|uniref:HDOD domain-containing protein n=1 Tax=Marinobacterium sediminicola TaxID=518898 RepID=UPI001EF0A1A3|nr:HDOD domain-containing protein [Marinobacterium sediminicola]ULG68659.1 HDOD domain-containing protein [Marinobacterium sediminicola]
MNAIYAQLDRLGDLPVFSATVNRIRQVSSSRESDAMALAMAVMKDANLSTKLLKIANTPSYNRSGGQISAVSRAVVLIGFERIQNLCVTLKLIESFRNEQPNAGVEQLLIRAFLNASLARELAAAAGALDIEETYICGLLYGLGEIIVAFTLPDTYAEMLRQRERAKERWPRIQLQQLGGNFSDIGQDLAQSWGFPKNVVQAMDPLTADQLRGNGRLNHRLAVGCHDLLELVYRRDTAGELDYSSLLGELAETTRQPVDNMDRYISEAFRQVCDLADEYGVQHRLVSPQLSLSDDPALDEMTRKLAYYVRSREARNPAVFPDESAEQHQPARETLLMERQLHHLQQMNELIAAPTSASDIIEAVVTAIAESSALERVAFCQLSANGQELKARICAGKDKDKDILKTFFQLHRQMPGALLFFRILEKRMTLLVPDSDEPGWQERLPEHFLQGVGPKGFIMAPLVVKDRVLGLMYADKGEEVEDQEFKVFNQFMMQARLGLEMLHSRR